jgi:hypothetical protein
MEKITMKNQGNALQQASAEYQREMEDALFAIEYQREINAFDKAFNHGKPALPLSFKVKKQVKAVTIGAVGRRHGNNAEYQKFFIQNMGMDISEFITMFNDNKIDSNIAESAVNVTIDWLRHRSTLGTDTFEQNRVFADYLGDVLNGKEKIVAKFATRKTLESLGSAYQIFNGKLQIRVWYKTQTPLFVAFLETLNLI